MAHEHGTPPEPNPPTSRPGEPTEPARSGPDPAVSPEPGRSTAEPDPAASRAGDSEHAPGEAEPGSTSADTAAPSGEGRTVSMEPGGETRSEGAFASAVPVPEWPAGAVPLGPPAGPGGPRVEAGAGGVISVVMAVLIGLWAIGVTVVLQGGVWFVEQTFLAEDMNWSPSVWPIVCGANAMLVGVPALLLALVPRRPGVRAAGAAWTWASVLVAVLGCVRAIPLVHHVVALGVLTLAAGVLALVARLVWRGQEAGEPRHPTRRYAVLAGTIVLLPWLWVGAAGGVLETILAVTAAWAVGALAAWIVGPRFWAAYADRDQARLVVTGGLAAGVALLLVGAATGPSGTQLLLMLVLPAPAFVAAALRRRAAHAWLFGLAAVGPLGLVDPQELTLLLGFRDIGYWALMAALASVGIALLLGLVYGLTLRPSQRPAAEPVGTSPLDIAPVGTAPVGTAQMDTAPVGTAPMSTGAVGTAPVVRALGGAFGVVARRVGVVAAVLALVAGGLVYVAFGHPGLYGDRVFVVMREQADLSGLDTITDRTERVRTTYRRLVDQAERTQAPLRQELDRYHLPYTPYYLVNGIEVDGNPVVRQWLASRSDVDRVLVSPRLRPLPEQAPTGHGDKPAPDGPQWNITMLRADRVWRDLGVTGSGVVVGTSDSGVDGTHPALRDGFRGGEDSWYDPWNGTRSPTDHGGHGTHTLGTAVGRGDIGIAPDARWVGCVNLDRNLGNPALYLNCLQFMLAPFPYGGDPFRDGRPDRAPQVLTNSWGCPRVEGCDREALHQAIAAIRAAGIFFAVAAGNTGPACGSVLDAPAPYAEAFTVGGVDRDRHVPLFASRGPAGGLTKPDIAAPAVRVLSAMPGGGYAEEDGTSMATPHVAGVVALMWSANPRLVGDIARTERILRDTAQPADTTTRAGNNDPEGYGDPQGCGPRNLVGAGVVDAFAAVDAARRAG